MSEPIELYDIDGNIIISHSPKVAEGLIEAGELFANPPVIEEKKAPSKAKIKAQEK